MRIIYLFSILYIGLSLSGCTSNSHTSNVTKTSKSSISVKKQPQVSATTLKKNPLSVKLFTGKLKPEKPYVVIGKETVSKYNTVGIKRQEANIRDTMRHYAATLGGDAVINITHDANSISGIVIAYKNKPNNLPSKSNV